MLGWMDSSLWEWQMEERGSVFSSPLSVFYKRRKWQDRSSNASVSLSPKGAQGLVEKGHIDGQRAQGADWPLWGRASHVVPQVSHRTLRSSVMETLQEGAAENPAFPHSPEKRRHTCGWWCCATAWQPVEVIWRHWHIRKDLLHRYIEQVVVISCTALL